MTRKGGKRPPPRVHEGESIAPSPADERAGTEPGDPALDGADEPVVEPVELKRSLADPVDGAGEGESAVDGAGEGEPAVDGSEAERGAVEHRETSAGEPDDAGSRDEAPGAVEEAPADGESELTGADDQGPGEPSPAADESAGDSDMPEGAGSQGQAVEAESGSPVADDADAPELRAERLDDELAAEAPRAVPGVVLSDELPIDPDDDLRGVEGEASPRLVSILESLLFSAAKPLSVKDLRRVLQETSQHQIQLGLRHLMEATRSRGIVLAQVAGGFQFRTHPDNAVWVQKMLQAKPAKLSRTQIETLAIIAYRQPVTRPEIDDIRGVDSGAVLKSLLEREMIQIVGKKEEPGRPLLYGTTVRFLEFFNLRSLRDLPTLRDFRDLSEESKATLRERLGDLQVAEALGQGVLGYPEGQGDANMSRAPGEAGAPIDPAAAAEAAEPVGAEEAPGEIEAVGLADQTEEPVEAAAAGDVAPEPEDVPQPNDEVDGAAGLVAHDELARDALPIDGVDPVMLPDDMTVEPPQVVAGGAAAQDDGEPESAAPDEPLPIAGDPLAADANAEEIVASTGEFVEAAAPAPEEFVAELAALVHTADIADADADEVDGGASEVEGGEARETSAAVTDEGTDAASESSFDETDGVAGEASETSVDGPGEAVDADKAPNGASDEGASGSRDAAGDAPDTESPAAGPEPSLAREGEEPQDPALGEPPASERNSTE